jgi:hypothetical protein
MKRFATWWALAERACASLFEPRIEVRASDRDVETLLQGSWIWSIGESFASKLHAAWLDSTCRSLLLRAVSINRT